MKEADLIIATRESPLALWQAHWVKKQLEAQHPDIHIKLLGITTQADKMIDISLTQIGGKGWFVKELEEALLDGRADIAVHSMKDVPMELPPGLHIAAICEREDPRDVFVSSQFENIKNLPAEAVVGTSSFRRQSQLKAIRPDLVTKDLRGNVNTRLTKMAQKQYDALILAGAGLIRLGLSNQIRHFFTIEEMLPAAGQGALGIECRTKDSKIENIISPLNDAKTAACVIAERALCRKLGGGCQVPIAAFAELAEIEEKTLVLKGLVGRVNGSLILRVEKSGEENNADALGTLAAEDLLRQGAQEILECLPKKI